MDGALISYSAYTPDPFRQAATYVDKILKCASPADLPIEQPTKFEFIINLKTAKAIGLTILPTLLVRANKLIELREFMRAREVIERASVYRKPYPS